MNPLDSAADQPSREQRLDELLAEYLQAAEAGRPVEPGDFAAAHPEFAAELQEFFQDQQRLARVAPGLGPGAAGPIQGGGTPDAEIESASPTSSIDDLTLDSSEGADRAATSQTKVRYFGDYELLEEIARGGMGVVYKTRQVNLKRIVALKMILVGQLANPDEVKRFYAEAQAAAKLEHPQIVPIFEIGQHEGQHYFTMAFIDGESLAHRVSREVLPPREAADILHKVARGIAFAHVEGVVHRDLKPANILLDRAGQPHVTDFGLAKRVGATDADDGPADQLTATGQVLGTPSFMPPEQAAGRTAEVGPLSDVYSLGAVLYCLLTGRPPFRAASPLDTLLQVIQQEPLSPRALNPSVPRDLETICLKCLEKDPGRRYETATALADELERYLQGEPIRARPISIAEQGWRRARKHHRLLKSAAAAVLATILLAAVGTSGWDYYRESQMSELSLKTGGYPLTAELLDSREDRVLRSFTVPTDQPIRLWRGEYRLRVTGPGLPGETLLTTLDARRRHEHTLDLATSRLWNPISLEGVDRLDVVQFGPRADVILLENRFGGGVLRRLAGDNLQPRWTLSLDNPPSGVLNDEAAQYAWREMTSYWSKNYAPRPLLMPEALDLNGDAQGDLIACWPLRGDIGCAALSGASGDLLWLHLADEASQLAALPIVSDVNADRTADLVRLAYRANGNTLWVEAISGADGTELWRRELDGIAPLNTSNSRFSTEYLDDGYRFPCSLVLADGGPVKIAIATTAQYAAGMRLSDGQPAWSTIDLGNPSASRLQWADVNGDGSQELLWAAPAFDAQGQPAGEVDFTVRTPGAEAPLWKARMPTPINSSTRMDDLASRAWAHVVDLDAVGVDARGKPELIVPVESSSASTLGFHLGMRALDGATGAELWTHPLSLLQQAEWKQSLDVADADGDGTREVVVVSTGPTNSSEAHLTYLFVDVLSGASGRSLAVWHGPLTRGDSAGFSANHSFESARWWQNDAEGRPQLLITTVDRSSPLRRRTLHFVSVLEGRETQRLGDVRRWQAADFNADGLADLGVMRDTLEGQRFQAFASAAPVAWRRLGELQPGQDYDGDGLRETIEVVQETQGAQVYSGRDGRTLRQHAIHWTSADIHGPLQCDAPPPNKGDFDGDGSPDMLISATTRLVTLRDRKAMLAFPAQAQSGKTGDRLWGERTEAIPAEILQRSPEDLYLMHLTVQCDDLDRDGRPEILCAYRLFWREKNWTGDVGQLWLAAVTSRDGTLLWSRPIGAIHKLGAGMGAEELPWLAAPGHVDLNGDGAGDIGAIVPTTNTEDYPPGRYNFELLAIDGRTGKNLWSQELNSTLSSLQAHTLGKAPQVHAVHLDGDRESVLIVAETLFDLQNLRPDAPRSCRLRAHNGKDGAMRWEYAWQSGGANSEFSAPQLSMASVDFEGNGQRTLCVRDYDNSPNVGGDTLHLLDKAGRLRKRIVGERSWNYDPVASRLWPIDLDGDGKQELVFAAGNLLRALRANGESVWERPDCGYITETVMAGSSALLVTAQGKNFLGISGRTGDVMWRGEGVPAQSPRPGQAWCLPPAKPDGQACILATGDEATVRVALSTDNAGQYREAAIPLRLPSGPQAQDPRLLRRLPWEYTPHFFTPLVYSISVSLLLVILPGAYARHMLRKRSWSLQSILGLPVAVGLAIVFLRLLSKVASVDAFKLGLAHAALAGTLTLIFPGFLLVWSVRRRWAPVALLLSASMLLALALGGIKYWMGTRDLHPLERIDWTWRGSWNLWFPAATVTGWLALFIVAARAGVSWWRAPVHARPVNATQRHGTMRTVVAAVALTVGGAAALAAIFVSMRTQPIPIALFLGWSTTAAVLLMTGLVLSRGAGGTTRRWVIVAPAVAAGLAGAVLAILTSDSGVEILSNENYTLWIKVFGKHFVLEQGALGPLEGKMLFWGTAIGVAHVAVASALGALLGAAVRGATKRTR